MAFGDTGHRKLLAGRGRSAVYLAAPVKTCDLVGMDAANQWVLAQAVATAVLARYIAAEDGAIGDTITVFRLAVVEGGYDATDPGEIGDVVYLSNTPGRTCLAPGGDTAQVLGWIDSADVVTLNPRNPLAIDASSYAPNSVGTAALAGDAVTGAELADDAVDSEHYTDDSIDTAHIGDLQVTAAKVAANAVETAKILDLNVTTAKLAADAVDGTKIGDDVLDSEHYIAGSIDTEHFAANAVDAAALGPDCVTGAEIGDDVVESEHYAAGSIDNEHLAVNSVDSDNYVDGSIDEEHMSADSVDSDSYVDGSIDEEHLAVFNPLGGLNAVRVAVARYSHGTDGGGGGAIDLLTTIPDNAVIIGGLLDVTIALTTADAAEGALHVEGAGDILAATVVSGAPYHAIALTAVIPVFTAATALKVTSAQQVTFTITVGTVTAGEFFLILFYVVTT